MEYKDIFFNDIKFYLMYLILNIPITNENRVYIIVMCMCNWIGIYVTNRNCVYSVVKNICEREKEIKIYASLC